MAKLLASAAVMWVNHTRAVQIPRWLRLRAKPPGGAPRARRERGELERGGEVQRMVIARALLAGAATRL